MALRTGHVTDTIAYLDNGLMGMPGVGTTYLVRGDELAIVETGTSLCAPVVLEGLHALGVRPRDVRHMLLTHIHMDHAGGAGALVDAMPDARVYIHSLTAQHLVEPTRLLSSAERALGEMFPRHGTIIPLPAEKLHAAEALDLDLGQGVRIRAIHTPGHSPDHLAYYESSSAALFVGDAAGIVLPAFRYLGPVTPPPAFDVEAQQATFTRLLELPIQHLLFSHWGPSTGAAADVITHLSASFDRFHALMREQIEHGTLDEDAIIRAMLPPEPLPADGEWVIAGWVRMSVKGMSRYYARRSKEAAKTDPTPNPSPARRGEPDEVAEPRSTLAQQ